MAPHGTASLGADASFSSSSKTCIHVVLGDSTSRPFEKERKKKKKRNEAENSSRAKTLSPTLSSAPGVGLRAAQCSFSDDRAASHKFDKISQHGRQRLSHYHKGREGGCTSLFDRPTLYAGVSFLFFSFFFLFFVFAFDSNSFDKGARCLITGSRVKSLRGPDLLIELHGGVLLQNAWLGRQGVYGLYQGRIQEARAQISSGSEPGE